MADWFAVLCDMADDEIDNGDFVTLNRVQHADRTVEEIQCFSGIKLTRTIYGDDAPAKHKGDKDSGEDIKNAKIGRAAKSKSDDR